MWRPCRSRYGAGWSSVDFTDGERVVVGVDGPDLTARI
jgi:hypothetical protein